MKTVHLVAYRDGVELRQLDGPDATRTCTVCFVPGVEWEVAIAGVHRRGHPAAYCARHEANARAEFEALAGPRPGR